MTLSSDGPEEQARRPRTMGRLLALATGLSLLAGLGGVLVLFGGKPTAAPVRIVPVPVHVTAARLDDVRHELRLVGTVLPLKDIVIRTQVDGILSQVLVQEGDMVRKGDLLATIDDRLFRSALQAAEGQLARNQALLKAADRELERALRLQTLNAVASATVDQRQSEVEQYRAAIMIDQANVETARVNLSFTRIFAPADGRVGLRQLDPGNNIRQTDTAGIVTLVQTDPVSVVFNVPQQQLARLQQYTDGIETPSVKVLDRALGREIPGGRITAFDNRIGGTNGAARVRAQFENGSGALTAGGFVSVAVETGRSDRAVVLPKHAVRLSIDGNFVFRVTGEVAERVPVEIGYSNEDIAVISKGVAAGERIVTDGFSRLRPKTTVRVLDGPAENAERVAEVSR